MIGLPSPATTAPVSAAKERQAISPRVPTGAAVRASASRVVTPARRAWRWPSRRPRTWSAARSAGRRGASGAAASSTAGRRSPPSGWPSAIAPPWGLVRAGSAPVSFSQAIGTLAKASFTSNAPMSARATPDRVEQRLGRRDRAGQHEHRVGADHDHGVHPGERREPEPAHGVARRRPAAPPRRRRPGWPARRSAGRPARSGGERGQLLRGRAGAAVPRRARAPRPGRSPRRTARRRCARSARAWLSSAYRSISSRLSSHRSAISSAPRNWEISWSP